jgi:hypothetical protein
MSGCASSSLSRTESSSELRSIKNRDAVLASLGRLKQVPTLVSAHALWGQGLSPADAQLLGSVLLSPGAQLWTRDKALKASAAAVGATTVDWD